MDEPLFEETQMMAWPFALIGLGSTVAGGWGAAARLELLARFGAAAAFAGAVLGLGCAFLLPMRTRVYSDRVEVRFGEFTRFRIRRAEIREAALRSYRPIWEYGGWGIRRGTDGWAYSMRGDVGVQLVLEGGRRVLIGSQRAAELAAVLQASQA